MIIVDNPFETVENESSPGVTPEMINLRIILAFTVSKQTDSEKKNTKKWIIRDDTLAYS